MLAEPLCELYIGKASPRSPGTAGPQIWHPADPAALVGGFVRHHRRTNPRVGFMSASEATSSLIQWRGPGDQWFRERTQDQVWLCSSAEMQKQVADLDRGHADQYRTRYRGGIVAFVGSDEKCPSPARSIADELGLCHLGISVSGRDASACPCQFLAQRSFSLLGPLARRLAKLSRGFGRG